MKNISFIMLSLSLLFVSTFLHSMEEATSDNYLMDALFLIKTHFYSKNRHESCSFTYDEKDKLEIYSTILEKEPQTVYEENNSPTTESITQELEPHHDLTSSTILGPEDIYYYEEYCKQLYENLKKNNPGVQTYSHPEDEDNEEFIRKYIEGINNYTNRNQAVAPNSFCADDHDDIKISDSNKKEFNDMFNAAKLFFNTEKAYKN